MKVVFIYRQKREFGHSIETLFHTLAREFEKNAEVIEYELGSRWHLFMDIRRLRKMQADIYHMTGDSHYVVPLLPHTKTVLTIHDTGHCLNDLRGFKQWLFKYLWFILPIKYAGRVTAISDFTRKSLINDLGIRQDIQIVDNCVSSMFHFVPKTFNEKNPVVLQMGTAPHKNLSALIDALSGTPCRLSIVGKLSEKHIQKLDESGIAYENHIKITHQEVFEIYVSADIVAFVSLYEGFGMPIIEANAAGRPLITSNIEPMQSIAGDAACIVDPSNVSDIHKGIQTIISNREYREKLLHNGLRNAENFSPARIADKYLHIYHELCPPV